MAGMRPTRIKPKAGSVRTALRLRFNAPAYALFDEVGNATGTHCRRHADAVAMSLWPSRGLDLHGIEIKVSRTDWLKELGSPEKADAIAQYCDFWWLAIGDEKIVQPGELPATWGLLVLRGDKLVCATEATRLEPQGTPKSFLAALLRKAEERMAALRLAGYREGFEEGTAKGPETHQRALESLESERDGYKQQIDDFEQASGIKLSRWDGGGVGKAVREFMQLRNWRDTDIESEFEGAAAALENAAKRLRDEKERIAAKREIATRGAAE